MERYYLGLSKCIAAALIIFLSCITAMFNVKKSRNALKNLKELRDVALVVAPLILTYSTFAILNGFVHTWVQDDTFFHLGSVLRKCSSYLATNWIAAVIISFCAVGHVPFLFLSASFRKGLSTKEVMLNLVSYLFAIIATVLYCCITPSLTEGLIDLANNSSKPVMWSLLYGWVCFLQFLGSGNYTEKKNTPTEHYKVCCWYFLTEAELANLLSRGKPTHSRENGEKGLGRTITSDDKIESPWIGITRIFDKAEAAVNYARELMNEGLDGSYATIEKFTESFSSKENSNIIYEIKKEKGEIVENNHQEA